MENHQLPLGWRRLTIGELVTDRGLFVDGDWVESKDQDPNGEIRLIQLADIKDGYFESNSSKHLTGDKAKELRCTPLKKDDILVARMPDPLGRACIFPGSSQECITAVDVCILRPNNPLIDIAWLKYAINSPETRKQILRLSRGTTRNRISRKDFSNIQLSVPPLDTQRNIVAILEKAEATQRLRAEADALMQKLIQSVFLEMFGDPVTNPMRWEKMSFRQIVDQEKTTLNPQDIKNKYYNYIGLENIESNSGKLISYHIDKTEIKSNKFLFTKNSILYGKLRPYLNKVFLPDFDGICSTDILVLKPHSNRITREYLATLMKMPFFVNSMTGASTGANLPRISPKYLSEFKIPVPPLSLQDNFTKVYMHIENNRNKQNECLLKTDILFNSLISKAFTGELVV